MEATIAPLPGALSLPSPHALRSLNILPIPHLILAVGIWYVVFKFNQEFRTIIQFFVTGLVSIILYLSLYSYHGYTTLESAVNWGYGYKELSEYIAKIEHKYNTVIITGHYWKPYIHLLFYR